MHHPQPGIFALGTPENLYLEIDLKDEHRFLDLVRALVNLKSFHTEYGANIVIGFRPSLWRAIHPDETPTDAADWVEPIVGQDGFTMPATPHDAWVWVAGGDRATVFDSVLEVRNTIAEIATVKTETSGWHYKEGRDLTGFIDGSENPTLIAASGICTVPEDQPGAASAVLVFQLWPHNVRAWTRLDTKAQEDAIGRSKADSIEMPDDVKPVTSHVARTVINVDGTELKIFRRNVAFGTPGQHGTVFVGFSCDQWRQFEMLRRMAGVDGIRDELTRYASATTGATYVIPSATILAQYVIEDDD